MRGIGEKSILMGCTFLRGDNFLSSLAAEIICLALRQVLSPTHTMTHFGENWGEEGVVLVEALPRCSQGLPEGV